MSKTPANRNSALSFRVTIFLLALVSVILSSLITTGAQQEPQSNQQQRPRRVSSSATQSATQQTQSTSAPNSEEVGEGDVVRVDTQLVSVPAVVTDKVGHPLSNLRAENFVLYEDGRPQKISNFATTDAPFEVVLLLDTSSSTRADLGLIRSAARTFIEALRPGDRVSIVAFNNAPDGGSTLATVDVLARLTDDRKALEKALENVGASNGTPYYDALTRIAQDIFHEPAREEVRGRRAVVALTDGVDSSSNVDYAEARSRLQSIGVACYFIEVNTEDFVEDHLMTDCQNYGALRLSHTQLERYRKLFLPGANADSLDDFCRMGNFERMEISRKLYDLARREMNDLARVSGGRTFAANDLRDARAAFAQVAHEIGTQYSLGYYPTNKTRDGRFRSIHVEVRGVNMSGAQVRAREGYYAPKG